MSMSSSEPRAWAHLKVRAEDAAAEIFVIDAHFHLVDRGIGTLETPLRPGVYKIKSRAGVQTWEQHIVVRDHDEEVVIPPLDFTSPAPLVHTAKTHEHHMQAASSYSREVHVTAGQGSWIFVFARDWTPPGREALRSPVATAPARGLSLRDLQGNQVIDLSVSGRFDRSLDPWAACNVQVTPGLYRLRLERPVGGELEQVIVAPPGWQTQIFLLQRAYSQEPDDRCADLPGASILLARGPGFTANSADSRRTELARLGLANQRRVLSDDIRRMLQDKAMNPMLGIYGAHLLLLEKQPDHEILQAVITNLRGSLGMPHPDVEALALLLESGAGSYVFDKPPMLLRSWSLIVDATVHSPNLVPLGSFAATVADRLWGQGPWLLWKEVDEEVSVDLEAALATQVQPRNIRGAVRRTTRGSDSPFAAIETMRAGTGERSASTSPEALAMPTPPDASARLLKPQLDEDTIQRLVQTLGVPRATLEHLVDTIDRKMQSQPE
jgi:hypothetical protein